MINVVVIGDNAYLLYKALRKESDVDCRNETEIVDMYFEQKYRFIFIPEYMCFHINYYYRKDIDILLVMPSTQPHKDDIIRRHINDRKECRLNIIACFIDDFDPNYVFKPTRSNVDTTFMLVMSKECRQIISAIKSNVAFYGININKVLRNNID